MCDTK